MNTAFPAIYVLSPQGLALALRIRAALGGVCFAPRSLSGKPGSGPAGPSGPDGGEGEEFRGTEQNKTPQWFDSLPLLLEKQFGQFRQHIFIAAVGLVVRCISPLLAGKAVDPAVVALDHHGKFVISLLSGHLGGANELARQVAAITGGEAVITTATDAEGLPAPDLLALRAGLRVLNPEAIRVVNAALLSGQTLGLRDPEGWLRGCLTAQEAKYFEIIAPEDGAMEAARITAADAAARAQPLAQALRQPPVSLTPPPPPIPPAPPTAQVRVDWRAAAAPENCLALIPPALCLGVGCRRGASAAEILELIHKTCADNALELKAVACLASTDLKADEAGLLEAARILSVPLLTFSPAELAVYPPAKVSPKAASALGLPGVCEPAARCAAQGGSLLLHKQTLGRVTLAVARRLPRAAGE